MDFPIIQLEMKYIKKNSKNFAVITLLAFACLTLLYINFQVICCQVLSFFLGHLLQANRFLGY